MDWKAFPSLAALRGFEATARRGTYVAAARELNVTDAALRQHVGALERFFGCKLVARAGRGIALTDEGQRLAGSVSGGFGMIANGVAALKADSSDRPVRVACTPAFAENWLMHRLPDFWERHPAVEIDLAPSLRNADLESGRFDMAIRYGLGDWGWPETARLASAAYTIVAAPSLPLPPDGDLGKATWLFEGGRIEHERWAAARGIAFHSPRNRYYPTNSLVLSAARAGHGLSVQSWALIERDTEAGTLVAHERAEDGPLAYYLLRATERKEATEFASWLLEPAKGKAANKLPRDGDVVRVS